MDFVTGLSRVVLSYNGWASGNVVTVVKRPWTNASARCEGKCFQSPGLAGGGSKQTVLPWVLPASAPWSV